MMRTAVIVIATAVLLAGCALQRPQSGDGQALLDQRQQAFRAALEARDAERMAALFSENAVLHVANMPPIEGRRAIHRFYQRVFGFLAASNAVIEHTRVADSGDLAYSIGSVRNTFEGADGPVSYAGKYLLIWSRSGHDWTIDVYSISSNQPDPSR
jgi:ketosteroid isomerase-like protein